MSSTVIFWELMYRSFSLRKIVTKLLVIDSKPTGRQAARAIPFLFQNRNGFERETDWVNAYISGPQTKLCRPVRKGLFSNRAVPRGLSAPKRRRSGPEGRRPSGRVASGQSRGLAARRANVAATWPGRAGGRCSARMPTTFRATFWSRVGAPLAVQVLCAVRSIISGIQ